MKTMKRHILAGLMLGMVLAVSPAAGYVKSAALSVSAAEVKLSQKKLTMEAGEKKTLKVKGTKKKAKWSTSNKNIAEVSAKGIVTAKKSGKAVISAKAAGKTYKCTVTVKKASLSHSRLTMTVGETKTLKLKGTKEKVRWTTSGKKTASVSAKGVVKAKKAGRAVITATAGQKTYTCTVTVKKKTASTPPKVTKPEEPWMKMVLECINIKSSNGKYPCQVFLFDFYRDGMPELLCLVHNTDQDVYFQDLLVYSPEYGRYMSACNNMTMPEDTYAIDTDKHILYLILDRKDDTTFSIMQAIDATRQKVYDHSGFTRCFVSKKDDGFLYRWFELDSHEDMEKDAFYQKLAELSGTYKELDKLAKPFTSFSKKPGEIDWDKYWYIK